MALVRATTTEPARRATSNEEPRDPGGKVMPTGRVGRQKRKEEKHFFLFLFVFLRASTASTAADRTLNRVISDGSVLKAKTKATKKNNGVAAEPGSGPEELRVR